MKSLLAPLVLLAVASARPQAPGDPAMPVPQKITTCLWFADDAEAAIDHYASVFEGSKVLSKSRWGEGGPLPAGTLMAAELELAGQRFTALNGCPYPFTDAVSLLVTCESQEEIDELWRKLGEGGAPGQCGWLKDRWGLSWQIVPATLGEMLGDADPARARRVAEAMMAMGKLDVRLLEQAYHGR